jgi:hypothetical protein
MTMSEMDLGQRQLPRHYGKYAGLVTDNGPPPGGGAHRGQLKVKVPGILEETSDGTGNQPIEVLAAPAFLPGCFFVPDVGAQVWVEFVAGDINSPIWTGVWYPNDKAPQAAGGNAPTENQKVIRTRSGQVITFDDADGSEQTVIKDEKNGSTVTLDQNGITIEASSSGSLTLKLGQTVFKMGSDGTTLTDSSGSAQGVVLKPLYDWITQTLISWLMSHQHVGNLGAPTPLMPVPLQPPLPTSISHT